MERRGRDGRLCGFRGGVWGGLIVGVRCFHDGSGGVVGGDGSGGDVFLRKVC